MLIGVFKRDPHRYEVTVVHSTREGKIVWSRPEIVVMITLGRDREDDAAHVLTVL